MTDVIDCKKFYKEYLVFKDRCKRFIWQVKQLVYYIFSKYREEYEICLEKAMLLGINEVMELNYVDDILSGTFLNQFSIVTLDKIIGVRVEVNTKIDDKSLDDAIDELDSIIDTYGIAINGDKLGELGVLAFYMEEGKKLNHLDIGLYQVFGEYFLFGGKLCLDKYRLIEPSLALCCMAKNNIEVLDSVGILCDINSGLGYVSQILEVADRSLCIYYKNMGRAFTSDRDVCTVLDFAFKVRRLQKTKQKLYFYIFDIDNNVRNDIKDDWNLHMRLLSYQDIVIRLIYQEES